MVMKSKLQFFNSFFMVKTAGFGGKQSKNPFSVGEKGLRLVVFVVVKGGHQIFD